MRVAAACWACATGASTVRTPVSCAAAALTACATSAKAVCAVVGGEGIADGACSASAAPVGTTGTCQCGAAPLTGLAYRCAKVTSASLASATQPAPVTTPVGTGITVADACAVNAPLSAGAGTGLRATAARAISAIVCNASITCRADGASSAALGHGWRSACQAVAATGAVGGVARAVQLSDENIRLSWAGVLQSLAAQVH